MLLGTSSQGSDKWLTGPVGTVKPIPGAPFSGRQVEERKQISSDGAVTIDIVTSQIYRDSAGRIRIEWCGDDRGDGRPRIVYLLDPVAYSHIILIPEQKLAHRDPVSRSSPAGFQTGLPGPGRPLPIRKWTTQTQSIGVRVVQGAEIQGTREVWKSDEPDGQPSLMVTWEAWTSQSLGLTLEVKVNGRGWAHTVELQDLNLHEPDLALFAIPPGYTIEGQELGQRPSK